MEAWFRRWNRGGAAVTVGASLATEEPQPGNDKTEENSARRSKRWKWRRDEEDGASDPTW